MNDRTKAVLLIVAAVLYVISPLDFIPDPLLGIGQLDDLVIGIMGFRNAKGLLTGEC
ncbi:YkvA family protein [Planctomicrobium sp. SH668]|uniref:YkvA family protein n=1 Tax=Planctomicrobium sp. SH668 TaxID=3448126 RepID=UPI003F5AE44A